MVIIDFIKWVATLLAGTHFDVSVPSAFWTELSNIVNFIGYFIPLNTVVTIIEINLIIMGIRIIIALLKMIWAILPIL